MSRLPKSGINPLIFSNPGAALSHFREFHRPPAACNFQFQSFFAIGDGNDWLSMFAGKQGLYSSIECRYRWGRIVRQ
jgi:hypothetical protein